MPDTAATWSDVGSRFSALGQNLRTHFDQARTTAPAVVNEKLIRKEYREVYMDLNSASVTETRHFVTDLGPDGLKAKPATKQGPSDSHDLGTKSMRFDGNWREDKMSEADYMKAYAEADAGYAKALQALIDEVKKAG